MPQCPGQDSRNLKSGYYRCTNCGGRVEMFSDEYRLRCPHCKSIVEKDAVPTCAAWCAAAKDCLGEERYQAYLEQSKKEEESGCVC